MENQRPDPSSQQRGPTTGGGFRGRGAPLYFQTPHGYVDSAKYLDLESKLNLTEHQAQNEKLQLHVERMNQDMARLAQRFSVVEQENAELKKIIWKWDMDTDIKTALALAKHDSQKVEAKDETTSKALEKECARTSSLEDKLKQLNAKIQELEAKEKKDLEQKGILEDAFGMLTIDKEILQTLNAKFHLMFKQLAASVIENSKEMEEMLSVLKDGGLLDPVEKPNQDQDERGNAEPVPVPPNSCQGKQVHNLALAETQLTSEGESSKKITPASEFQSSFGNNYGVCSLGGSSGNDNLRSASSIPKIMNIDRHENLLECPFRFINYCGYRFGEDGCKLTFTACGDHLNHLIDSHGVPIDINEGDYMGIEFNWEMYKPAAEEEFEVIPLHRVLNSNEKQDYLCLLLAKELGNDKTRLWFLDVKPDNERPANKEARNRHVAIISVHPVGDAIDADLVNQSIEKKVAVLTSIKTLAKMEDNPTEKQGHPYFIDFDNEALNKLSVKKDGKKYFAVLVQIKDRNATGLPDIHVDNIPNKNSPRHVTEEDYLKQQLAELETKDEKIGTLLAGNYTGLDDMEYQSELADRRRKVRTSIMQMKNRLDFLQKN